MPQLHPLLAARWSPLSFDSRHDVDRAELASLLEAARWAPSAGNGQPWRFVVGRRDDETHKRIFEAFAASDQRWAWRASALIVVAYDMADAATSRSAAAYDLGQAVAHLGVQATALRLHTRQVTAVDVAALHADLHLPPSVTAHAVVAVGRLGDPDRLPDDLRRREFRLRERRPVAQLLLAGDL